MPLAWPEWAPCVEHLDRQVGRRPSRAARSSATAVRVQAARVEADDELGRAESIGQTVDVSGQVGAAALLARLDEHDAAAVGDAGSASAASMASSEAKAA